MKVFTVRATLAVALSFSALTSWAQNKTETYKDIIEKAYNLSLQRDRQQALNILTTAIRRETKPAALTELKRTLGDIAGVFFSDKAQQLYEVGVSLRKTDLNQSLAKISEASRIEPDNSVIVAELARLNIAKGDCSNAQDLVTKQLRLSPYEEELKLVSAQASLCQNRYLEVAKSLDSKEIAKSSLLKFWLALEVEKNFKEKNFVKAQETLNSLTKLDSKYPEIPYWNWKLDNNKKIPNVDAAQKYVMSCKNISASQYRQYMIDPMLCRHMAEMESDIKGLNGITE